MKNPLCITALVLALFLVSSPAPAGTVNAVLNGKSYHFNSSYDWNENNSGLGLEYEFEQTSAWKKIVMANGFRDSTDNMSYMAGAGLHRRLYELCCSSGNETTASYQDWTNGVRKYCQGGRPIELR